MKGLKNCQKGFSLTEVLIGIMILTVAIVSATSLLVGLINSNKNNVKTLQAYYLAQEGIEAVRNIRDTNWLYNIPWQTHLDAGDYVIALNNDLGMRSSGADNDTGKNLEQLFDQYSAWEILPAVRNSEIRLKEGAYLSSEFDSGNATTGFTRTVTIAPYKECDTEKECLGYVLVQSKVTWRDNSTDREVILEEILTDWKGGAI